MSPVANAAYADNRRHVKQHNQHCEADGHRNRPLSPSCQIICVERNGSAVVAHPANPANKEVKGEIPISFSINTSANIANSQIIE
jgi:hypothetical protein